MKRGEIMKKKTKGKIESFPELSLAEIAFGEYPKDFFDKVLKMPKEKNHKDWEDKVNKLFFSGGTIPTNDGNDAEYINNGLRVFKAILGSFTPKHEHKVEVCAKILRSLN
jgi:hypothetical protein